MTKSPSPHLLYILDTVAVIKKTKPTSLEALLNNPDARDASLMRLQDIGEQLSRLRDNFPDYYEQHGTDDWPKIIGMRNIISHGYREIDFAIVWDVIDKHIEPFAKQFEQCVNIEADHVKHMVVSGFYYDKEKPEDPNGWGFNEWELVGESVGLLAQNFLKHNYDVVINGYIDESAWKQIQKYVSIIHKVLLLPDLATSVTRDKLRHKDYAMGEEAVRVHFEHFSKSSSFRDFVKINSSNMTVNETTKEIRRVIDIGKNETL